MSMPIITVLALLIGTLLGLRFNILLLVPAIVTVLIVLFAGGLARGHGLASAALVTFIAASGLQIGYLCGALVRQKARTPQREEPFRLHQVR